jgi:hypothetical protein
MAGSLSRYFGGNVRHCLKKVWKALPALVRGLAERCKPLNRTGRPFLFAQAEVHFSEQAPMGAAS